MSWKLDGSKGQWTREGCDRIGGDNWSSICACNHFSSFVITMATQDKVRPRVLRAVSCSLLAQQLSLDGTGVTSRV